MSYKALYPKEETIKEVRIDPGTEFRGELRELLVEREVKVTTTLPRMWMMTMPLTTTCQGGGRASSSHRGTL